MSFVQIVLCTFAVAALFMAAGVSLVIARRGKRTAIDVGASNRLTVLDTDTGGAGLVTLRDAVLGLRGKPDYILESVTEGRRRLLVPLEVKPTRRSSRLYETDRIQIGGYLLALRATFPQNASRLGYVRYAERTFDVVLTPDLETEIERLVRLIRRGRFAAELHRSHSIPARCRACPMRASCGEALS